MIVLTILVEYTIRVVTLCACVIILCWSGCDYFQCDREIHFMYAGQCGVIIDGGRWLYVVWCHKYRHISAHTYVSASRRWPSTAMLHAVAITRAMYGTLIDLL